MVLTVVHHVVSAMGGIGTGMRIQQAIAERQSLAELRRMVRDTLSRPELV